MEFQLDDDDEAIAQKFREYAAECLRLARSAAEEDRAVLIEIADAWMACAEQAKRDGRRNRGH
jgi:phosphoribosyl-ATP pyrophosphohydrolase